MQALINSVIYAIEKPHTPITHYIFTKDGECTRFVFDRDQYSVANLKLLLNMLIKFYIRFSSIPTPVSTKLISEFFLTQFKYYKNTEGEKATDENVSTMDSLLNQWNSNDVDKNSEEYQEILDALVKLWNDNTEAVLFQNDDATSFLFEGSDIFNHFDELSEDQKNLIISFFKFIKDILIPITCVSIKE